MSATMKETLKAYALEVEGYLAECLKGRGIPCGLIEAMEYSLHAGGKRLRPVLCLAFAELYGMDRARVMPFAGAIECIHTYSLVHDDLPAMDNDDLRRGLPTNHVKFGEAAAILAGDGLLTDAFDLMTSVRTDVPAEQVLEAVSEMARAAGAAGMVGGQALDMEYTGRDNVTLEMLKAMHAKKTGALLTSSCTTGAILAGASAEEVEKVRAFGENIGVAFQIVDDILDEIGDEATLGKPVGSDIEEGKVTYPSLIGLDESRNRAQEHIAKAIGQLEGCEGPVADFLRDLAQYIVDRVY